MMIGRRPLCAFGTVLLALTLAGSTALPAQQTVSGRWRVLIPDFQPINDEDDDFGKDLADELRDLIDDMLRNRAVDEDDIKDALKKYGLKMEGLTCNDARALALQENYQVVLCARYAGTKEAWQIQDIKFVLSETGEEFEVDPIMSADKMEEEAARQIVQAFELFNEQTRVAIFCGEEAQSLNWENALGHCDRALELNPNSNTTRYTRAFVLKETERYEESLAEVQRLLVRDPYHQSALSLGGFLASNLDGQEALARDFYNRYLEQDPMNAAVRMRVAFDLAQQGGDPLGGMLIIEQGVALDPGNISFYEQLGNFAFAGAERVRSEAQAADPDGDGLTPEVREIYGKAIAAYERVFLEKGEEMSVSQLRNVVAAQLTLGNLAEAIEFGERAVASHPEEASLRDIYSRALQESGRITEAIAALAAIEEIDPDWPDLHLRMADMLIREGHVEEAVPVLETAVAKGTEPDRAANMIFAYAFNNYIQPEVKNYPRFIDLIQLAEQFEVSTTTREQYEFFHAYTLYEYADDLQAPEAADDAARLASANLTLPMFREALVHFQRGKGHTDRTEGLQYELRVQNTRDYIDIQERLIERASRR